MLRNNLVLENDFFSLEKKNRFKYILFIKYYWTYYRGLQNDSLIVFNNNTTVQLHVNNGVVRFV